MTGTPVSNPLGSLRRVRVGSTNSPKLEAVRDALRAYAPDVEVEGVAVASGVPEQPVGFAEIVQGARNRAARAVQCADCDLGIGIEDGLVELTVDDDERGHWNLGCAAVTDGKRVSLGFSSAFAYPPACTSSALDGRQPIGDLFDRFWAERRGEPAQRPSARGIGNIGKLSLEVLPRSAYSSQAVVCALLPFLHPDLYGREDPSG